ncbi:ADP-ribosylation factor-like protein 4A isoform X1 [Lucilia sericata]|uniref:ADP-ribosylation factor-like protein 4A isoform X1 n=2 Tax=Lucilia sericata TaxID=13632 RepID=UPI0018A82A1C|nr:ADP-ribosylation factor-like protein 4A isoform X1 [Lucilia sericata]
MGTTMGKNGNFLDALPSQGTLHVVMLGLDSAGKTTALYRLKFDQYLNTVPTIGFNCEKVQGMVGKAKGVQFLVWDVGGQEKLRPLWRSYTRCTDGILFVVDSVDVERMEEAKMELMRTAKCPDNQGVPVLILANKQDLPGAREPKELEKLLGLHELLTPNSINISTVLKSCSSSTGNIVATTKATENENVEDGGYGEIGVGNTSSSVISSKLSSSSPSNQQSTRVINDMQNKAPSLKNYSSTSLLDSYHYQQQQQLKSNQQHTSQKSLVTHELQTNLVTHQSSPSSLVCTPTSSSIPSSCNITNNTSHHNDNISKLTSSATSSNINNSTILQKSCSNTSNISTQYKGWYIQPACAITGEGLQEGLEALYDMILKRRKIQKIHKKRR